MMEHFVATLRLHYAVNSQSTHIVSNCLAVPWLTVSLQELLISHPQIVPAAVGDLSAGGALPLHLAAAGGCVGVVLALLAAGAPLEARDGKGLTALQVCSAPPRVAASTGCLQLLGVLPGQHIKLHPNKHAKSHACVKHGSWRQRTIQQLAQILVKAAGGPFRGGDNVVVIVLCLLLLS
jgi:hypothetical protein